MFACCQECQLIQISFLFGRHVREVKNHEDEIRQVKRKIDNFDRYANTGNAKGRKPNLPTDSRLHAVLRHTESIINVSRHRILFISARNRHLPRESEDSREKAFNVGSAPDLSTAFEKDFECSVCLEDMRPPVKIFQCRNGHVMCQTCK